MQVGAPFRVAVGGLSLVQQAVVAQRAAGQLTDVAIDPAVSDVGGSDRDAEVNEQVGIGGRGPAPAAVVEEAASP
ncbi:hypothetical protein ADL00_45225 [Streptomyces sp. AS58]|uniref:hypothetical protein n=1 Tax=Streptomyces sp. AS58 TaxID=1519489 RepID=UPI0006ADBCE8|nr:hypothetical protein [Streptomyces sp. AS58]KOV49886.1 hypothetical protein ADL00_45225 [Streptomyces sp. AS58]